MEPGTTELPDILKGDNTTPDSRSASMILRQIAPYIEDRFTELHRDASDEVDVERCIRTQHPGESSSPSLDQFVLAACLRRVGNLRLIMVGTETGY